MDLQSIKGKMLRPDSCEFCAIYLKDRKKALEYYEKKIIGKSLCCTSTEIKMMKYRLEMAFSDNICPECGRTLTE